MTTRPKFPATPELDKIRAVQEKSQAIGDFLAWLECLGWILATPHRHDDGCLDDERVHRCGYTTGELQSEYYRTEHLLAEHFGIDLDKVEEERRGLLDYQRYLNERQEQGVRRQPDPQAESDQEPKAESHQPEEEEMMPDENDAARAFAKELAMWVTIGIGIGVLIVAAVWEVAP